MKKFNSYQNSNKTEPKELNLIAEKQKGSLKLDMEEQLWIFTTFKDLMPFIVV